MELCDKYNRMFIGTMYVGAEVHIRHDLVVGVRYGGIILIERMARYCGRRSQIKAVWSCDCYILSNDYIWSDEMFYRA